MKITAHPLIEFFSLYLKNLDRLTDEERKTIIKVVNSLSNYLFLTSKRHLSCSEVEQLKKGLSENMTIINQEEPLC